MGFCGRCSRMAAAYSSDNISCARRASLDRSYRTNDPSRIASASDRTDRRNAQRLYRHSGDAECREIRMPSIPDAARSMYRRNSDSLSVASRDSRATCSRVESGSFIIAIFNVWRHKYSDSPANVQAFFGAIPTREQMTTIKITGV